MKRKTTKAKRPIDLVMALDGQRRVAARYKTEAEAKSARQFFRSYYPEAKFSLERKPAPKKKKRNPDTAEADAAAVSESFHGRPAKSVKDYEEIEARRTTLADLGRLIELVVLDDDDNEITLGPFKAVRCACSPEKDAKGKPVGRSIYFVSGDQALNLEALGIDGRRVKDQIRIGDAVAITYFTSKAFHDFEPSDYEHQFGEETGDLPTLNYDTLSRRLFLTGGSYEVRPEGIVD
jgi:hypothetical protein